VGSPKWTNSAFAKGSPLDWVVCQQRPPNKLRSALELDRNTEKNQHLLHPKSYHNDILLAYMPVGAAQAGAQILIDGTHITTVCVGMMPTSRGMVQLASTFAGS
jgi:hypothetical protein